MQILPPNFVRHRTCRTSCIATALTCVHGLPGNLLAATRRRLFFVMEPQLFLHVYPWTSDSTTFSAFSVGVDAHNCLVGVVDSFATHLARTVTFLGSPLSVSAHPVLMGAFPVSRRHASLETLVCILWRRMYSTSHVLPWRTAQGQATRLCCHPNATLPKT